MSINPDQKDLITLALIKRTKDDLEAKLAQIKSEIEQIEAPQGEIGPKGDKGDKGNDGRDGRDGQDGKDGKDGRDGRDGQDGRDGVDGKDGDIKELSPDEIRDSLELLKGEDRLDKSAIKGLEEFEQRVETNSKRVISGGMTRMLADSLYAPIGSTGGITDETDPVWLSEKSSYYTKTEADNRYVNVTGDTMTGVLRANAGIIIRSGQKLVFDGA